MHPMKPMPGMSGGYFSLLCSLRVEVTSYEEKNGKEIIELKVIRKLGGFECRYNVGDKFTYERKIGEEENLEGLVLDGIAQ